jgi:RND superfamily putative drug exporter
MKNRLFYKFGSIIYRFRLAVVFLWVLIILSTIPFLSDLITPFKSTGFIANNSESDKTDKFLKKNIDYHDNRLLVLYSSKDLRANTWAYHQKIKKSLAGLKKLPLKSEIIYPIGNKSQISKDKHTAYAVVLFKDNKAISNAQFKDIISAVKKPPKMTMRLGGERVFVENVNRQTQKDLYKADVIAGPITIIILILVFGTLVAALVPVVLGGGCALIILTTLHLLAELFNLSIFTLNIALLLGLCLSLDYSLFIISRFRDEYRHDNNILRALSQTMATAGKAIFFSGLTVFISLSALIIFPVNILFSLGIGGLAAVGFSVLIALTLLPAVLGLLKKGINALSLYKVHRKGKQEKKTLSEHFWLKIAKTVVSSPLTFFFSALVILVVLSYPFMHAKFGISDYKILPPHSESREFFDVFNDEFDGNELTPITMVILADKGKILYRSNLNKLYAFTQKLKKNPLIKNVTSIVTTTPQLKSSEYYVLYKQPKKRLNSKVKQFLKTTTTDKFTLINIVSKYDADSTETRALIRELREMSPGQGLSVRLGGGPVNNLDVLDSISAYFPYALLWIMCLTYLVLLCLLRSLILPLKAILMTMLSLAASYGVLVFVFQEGHFQTLLNFDMQGMLDISLLVIIFCALFGFSMDYEVFLLTRIQEYYLKTKNNDDSIIFGIVKSSKVITSAAIIVIFICGSFMVADVLMVKAFGLGIAVAIFVDAFIIRTLFVPATMVLLKKWNWYLPRWLDKCLPGK